MAKPDQQPDWPTTVRSRLGGGKVIGTDNSMWLYRAAPLGPVVDAAHPIDGFRVAHPIMAMFEEIAEMTQAAIGRRSAARSSYRKIHMLLVNVPERFTPPRGHPLEAYFTAGYANRTTAHRVLLFGVRLRDKIGGTGGLRDAVESVAQTLASGTTPIEDYDNDYNAMDAAFARSGFVTPLTADFRLANAWWNRGEYPDTPVLVHGDHLHVFRDSVAAQAATAHEDFDAYLAAHPEPVPGHAAVSFAAVQDFDLDFVPATDPLAHWASDMVDRGAVAISVRGLVEPAKITRGELRRRRKQYLEDINERAQAGKMERAEQDDKLDELTEVEAGYAAGGSPTIVDTSVIIAFNGMDDDLPELGQHSGLILNTMSYRQHPALMETMICSPVRANPHLHDLPTQTIACSGLPSLSRVGDAEGAMPGFTERDGQPAFLSPVAASNEDELPICLTVGQTGSGKLLTNDTILPTPLGRTTIGALTVGDQVLGRDGKPHNVEAIFENPTPELYDVHLSDGQTIRACVDHQWIVSDWQDRNSVRHPHRTRAAENFQRAQQLVDDLQQLAAKCNDSDELTAPELMAAIIDAGLETSWGTPEGISHSLDFVDCPSGFAERHLPVTLHKRTVVKNDPVVLFPLGDMLRACRDHWGNAHGGNAVRWAESLAGRIAAANDLLDGVDEHEEVTSAELNRRLAGAGASMSVSSKAQMSKIARSAGIVGRPGRADVTIPMPDSHSSVRQVRIWSAPLAFKFLALRVTLMFQEAPSGAAAERVLTTGEMFAAGVKYNASQSNYAIRVTAPLDLPTIDAPVDPYILGAWLGDGTSNSGGFTQGAVESCTDANGLTDQAHLVGILTEAGYEPRVGPDNKAIGTRGLAVKLRDLGLKNNKHIPMTYLRASKDQRLAVLQGLMDTDGHIDPNGACELTLCNERLATDAIELIRTLGIKASMRSSAAAITEADPDNPGEKRRRITSTRYRILFTTTTPVFRLPRKAARIPEQVRETQEWLYITDITPAPSEPGRCITVDSDDHSYLVAGFVPTHNTILLLMLADQFARMGNPVVIVDPKALALDTRVPTPAGRSTIGDLQVGDEVFGGDGHPCQIVHKSRVFPSAETQMYEFSLDDGQRVRADANHQWVVYANNDRLRLRAATDAEVAGWKRQSSEWAALLRHAAVSAGDGAESTTYELLDRVRSLGVTRWAEGKTVSELLHAGGLLPARDGKRRTWPTAVAMKVLAEVLEVNADAPFGRVLTTTQILESGVKRGAQSRFAIPVAQPVVMPETDLPIDPYLFGVWLGDGDGDSNGSQIYCHADDLADTRANLAAGWPNMTSTKSSPTVAAITLNRDFDRCLYGHDDYETRTSLRCATCEREHRQAYRRGEKRVAPEMVNPSFIHLLRQVGVYNDKHIPDMYMRASIEQRTALLQGLMDSDGTVKTRGDLRIVVTRQTLADGICELVRSLGIKATIWEGDAKLTEPDPDRPGHKRSRFISREWNITFRTPAPMFQLPRKAAIQRERSADTPPIRSRFNYLTDVRPIASEDAQCLRVNSPDHTYLVENFVVTHNSGSDHTVAVEASGGQVSSLDDLTAADGVFDPLRFAVNAKVGIDMASAMLSSVNVWGSMKDDYEAPLSQALSYGVEEGATCIGQALILARDAGKAPADMVDRVLGMAKSSPMFRACVGIEPGSAPLRFAPGITLIKVGDAHLDLPEPGQLEEASLQQRIALALVRMMVFGSSMALTGREGVVMLDEAWVFLGAGRAEVERLGRLARSQGVLPMLFTQRVTDALDAKLDGYISRGIILPIKDVHEAEAACRMFKLEPTQERMGRITAPATVGSIADGTGAPNWNSMRALRDRVTGQVLRGSIGIYADLYGRAIPIEITVPPGFLAQASTNPEDVKTRRAEMQRELTETTGGE